MDCLKCGAEAPDAYNHKCATGVPPGFVEWFNKTQCELYDYYTIALEAYKAGMASGQPCTRPHRMSEDERYEKFYGE